MSATAPSAAFSLLRSASSAPFPSRRKQQPGPCPFPPPPLEPPSAKPHARAPVPPPQPTSALESVRDPCPRSATARNGGQAPACYGECQITPWPSSALLALVGH